MESPQLTAQLTRGMIERLLAQTPKEDRRQVFA
jgi:hypothetical protein